MKRLVFLVISLCIPFFTIGQIVGGAGIIHGVGEPDTIISITQQNASYESLIYIDTLTWEKYEYYEGVWKKRGFVNYGDTQGEYLRWDTTLKEWVSSPLSVNLASEVTGVLPIANGGTGSTTLAEAGIATISTGTTNYLPKYTAGTVLGNSQIYDDGTNVGINTIPTEKLQIQGSVKLSSSVNQFLVDDFSTASKPGYSFVTSNNTGIYRPISNTLGFSTNGTERLRINDQGNFSFGTSSTAYGTFTFLKNQNAVTNLSIVNTSNTSSARSNISLGAGSGAYTSLIDYPTNYNAVPFFAGKGVLLTDSGKPNGFQIYTSNGPITFTTLGNTHNAILTASGNFGIGTTSPSQKLHVIGNIYAAGSNSQFLGDDGFNNVTTPTYSFSGNANTGMYRPANNTLGFVTNGVERVRLHSTGNVSIGTTTDYTNFGGVALRVYQSGVSSASLWRGRIVAGGDQASILFGELDSFAVIGGHSGDLGAWNDIYIQPSGSKNVYVGYLGPSSFPSGSSLLVANKIGINTTSPARTLHVAGEARITDLTTDTPTKIVGADDDGDLGAITVLPVSMGGTGSTTLSGAGITTGSGTSRYLPRYDGTTTFVNSPAYVNTSNGISIGTTSAGLNSGIYNYKNVNNTTRTFLLYNHLVNSNNTNVDQLFEAQRNTLEISGIYNSPSTYLLSNRALSNILQYTNTSGGTHVGTTNTLLTYQLSSGSTVNLSDASGLRILTQASSSTATVNDYAAIYIDNQSAASTVNTSYGLRIINNMGTTRYGIHQSGSNNINYFQGNIGIGVSNPLYSLHTNGSIVADGTSSRIIAASATGTAASPTYSFGTLDQGDNGMYNPADNVLAFSTNGVERVRIDGSGNTVYNDGANNSDFRVESQLYPSAFLVDAANDRIGIGSANTTVVRTDDPNFVFAPSATTPIFYNHGNNGPGSIYLGNLGGGSNLVNGAKVGDIKYYAKIDSLFSGATTIGAIESIYTGNGTTRLGDIVFKTANGSSEQERLRITSAGNVGIGTTSPSERLQVVGNIAADNLNLPSSSSTVGAVNINGIRHIHFRNGTFVGSQAGNIAMTGLQNTGIGQEVLRDNTTGTFNTGIGHIALRQNTTGGNNVAIGRALEKNTTGNFNIAIGDNALQDNTTSSILTAIGYNSLANNTTGTRNTAVGYSSLAKNTTGIRNTAIGSYALGSANTGNHNVSIGDFAGEQNNGSYNVSIGSSANWYNSTGSDNVAIGYQAGLFSTNAAYSTASSIFIGTATKPNASGEENQIVIGHGVTGAGSNSVVLGNSNITKTILRSNVGIGITSPSHPLHVNGNIFADGPNAQFLGDDGVNSVSTPTFSFADDTDNGIYRPADNTLGLVTNGVERVRLHSTGNVSIGTTTDYTNFGGVALRVYQSGVSNTNLWRGRIVAGGDQASILFGELDSFAVIGGHSGNLGAWDDIYIQPSGGKNVYVGYLGSSSPPSGSTSLLVANKIGINTTSPSRTLHVVGEARITDLDTDIPTRIVGADADGDLGAITVLPVSMGGTGSTTLSGAGITTGSGTSGYLPRYNGTTTFVNSPAYVNTSNGISIGTTSAGVNSGIYNYKEVNNTTRTFLHYNHLVNSNNIDTNQLFEAQRNSLQITGIYNSGTYLLSNRTLFNGLQYTSTSGGTHVGTTNTLLTYQLLSGSSVNLSDASGLRVLTQASSSTATVNDYAAIYIDNQSAASTVNTSYGLRIINNMGTTRYGIHQSGSNNINYFQGNIGIGVSSPLYSVHTNGSIVADGTSSRILAASASGTAASPTYSFGTLNQGDNGMYNPADNVLAFSTNGTERVRIDDTGRVGIGTTNPGSPLTIRGTSSTDGGQLGAELLSTTGWTSTDWTGDFATGFTHTTGNITALTNTLAAVVNNYYQIAYTITNRTAGSISISFGGETISIVTASGAFGPRATTTGTLSITPTTDFNGTIVISIRVIAQGSPLIAIQSSNGQVVNHVNTIANNQTNVLFGLNTGLRMTTGTENVAIGRGALQQTTTPRLNTAIGDNALQANTVGAFNTSVGGQSLVANISGNSNVAVGQGALTSNTTGSNNTGLGASSLVFNTFGSRNTAVGRRALLNISTGNENVAIGMDAGSITKTSELNTNSSQSIYIGYLTRANAIGDSNQIVIGNNAIGAGSNSVVLGNTDITKTVLRGNVGIGISSDSSITKPLDVNGEARIRDLSSTASTKIVGADNNGNLGSIALGSGLSLSGGTLSSSGTFSGSISANQVAYGSASNTITSSSNFIYSPSLKTLILATDTDEQTSTKSNLRLVNTSNNYSESNIDFGHTSGDYYPSARIASVLVNPTTRASNLIFYARKNNFLQESFRVDSFLNVGINTITPAQKLSVNGNIWMPMNSTTGGGIYAGDDLVYHNYTTGNEATNIFLGKNTGNRTTNNLSEYNTVVGYDIMQNVTTGDTNTAIGYKSLNNLTTGFNNIALGISAGANITTGSNNLYIGNNVTASSINVSNEYVIGKNLTGGGGGTFKLGGTDFSTIEIRGSSAGVLHLQTNSVISHGNFSVNEKFFDGSASAGNTGQRLESTGAKTKWVSPNQNQYYFTNSGTLTTDSLYDYDTYVIVNMTASDTLTIPGPVSSLKGKKIHIVTYGVNQDLTVNSNATSGDEFIHEGNPETTISIGHNHGHWQNTIMCMQTVSNTYKWVTISQ